MIRPPYGSASARDNTSKTKLVFFLEHVDIQGSEITDQKTRSGETHTVMPRSVLNVAVHRKIQRERKRKRIGMGLFAQNVAGRYRKNRVVAIGTWNTRQIGAQRSKFDQYLKFRHMSQLWEQRGWEMVILTDTAWGRHCTFNIRGHTQTWQIISRGKVSIALNHKWAKAWQASGTVVHTDGTGAHCRVIMIQIQCYRKLGLALMGVYSPSSKVRTEELEEHLEDITRVMSRCKPRCVLIAGGDFNAETGGGSRDSANVIGPHGWVTCNKRGQKLLRLCTENDLVDAHSWTPQRNKATWTNPPLQDAPLDRPFLNRSRAQSQHTAHTHATHRTHTRASAPRLDRVYGPQASGTHL